MVLTVAMPDSNHEVDSEIDYFLDDADSFIVDPRSRALPYFSAVIAVAALLVVIVGFGLAHGPRQSAGAIWALGWTSIVLAMCSLALVALNLQRGYGRALSLASGAVAGMAIVLAVLGFVL